MKSAKDKTLKVGRGRPATGHDPLVCARMPDELTARVDAWAKTKTITRSEAVRQLVERGLRGK